LELTRALQGHSSPIEFGCKNIVNDFDKLKIMVDKLDE
jgi:hypothetical protein